MTSRCEFTEDQPALRETSKIVVSFRDKGAPQLPLMMIIREYYVGKEVVYAELLHSAETYSDLEPYYKVDEIG
jgi:hypothetical protein